MRHLAVSALLLGLASPLPVFGQARTFTRHRLQLTATLPLVQMQLTPTERTWFALDTGASGTTVTPELAERLGVTPTDTATIITIGGRAAVGVVTLDDVGIVGRPERWQVQAAVHDLAELRRLAPDAEGILGQDVLARHDYLIDFRRGELRLGRFDPPPDGRRLPLSWSAGRPLVHVEGRSATYRLVLDTGADALYIATAASDEAIGWPPPVRRWRSAMRTHLGEHAVDVEQYASLALARVPLGAIDVVRVPERLWRLGPEVGLLPAGAFRRVYVSARNGHAEVWER